MTWLNTEDFDLIHDIRQRYAIALSNHEANPTQATQDNLQEMVELRARAMRTLVEETEVTPRQLAGMFRCSKKVVRDALS